MELNRNEINFIRYMKKYKPKKYDAYIFNLCVDKKRLNKNKIIDNKNESYIKHTEN